MNGADRVTTKVTETTTYDADSASHCFRRQVLPELGSHTATVAMGTGHLTPDDTQVVLLGMAGRGRQPEYVIVQR